MEINPFLIDEESYQLQYLPVFKDRYKVKIRNLIQFSILLPFQIPFQDNSIISFPENDSILSYTLTNHINEKEYTGGSLVSSHVIEYHLTKVEMSFFTSKNYYYLSEKVLSDIFNVLLDGLNDFITAYLIKKKDVDIYKVSKEMLEPICVYRKVNIENNKFNNNENGLFMLNHNIVHMKDLLDFTTQSEVADYAIVVKDNINPFILSQELMLTAKRNFKQGFYKEAVLNAQTSIETFLRTIIKECLKIEGLNSEEINEFQESTNFITMVKRDFSKRIGGSWDITNIRKDVGRWYKDCYSLRNKIIHSGYNASFTEADNALDVAFRLRMFVYNRILKSKKYESISIYL
ncbi:hypothetical protein [Oceanobacillus profundus]|uniref:hypothetical protein n=1 Tax=Oceanobacillus TaxID=182709 RepID=UPI0026E132EF|nr:hypothetical protein [Oceanobacillus profundus]MDO6448993.1 hypothetical protein [Oceanobacillus profundus]